MVDTPDEVWLKPAEVAGMLQVTQQSLMLWRQSGKGPPYIKVGGRYRYPKSEVLKYLKEIIIHPENAA